MKDNDKPKSGEREEKSLDPSALVPKPKRPQQDESGEGNNRVPKKPPVTNEKK